MMLMLMLMLLSLLGKHREACLILAPACIVDWIGGNNPDGVGKA